MGGCGEGGGGLGCGEGDSGDGGGEGGVGEGGGDGGGGEEHVARAQAASEVTCASR